MKPEFQQLMEVLGRKGCLAILSHLKNGPKRWSDLDKIVKDKRALSYRIKELLNLGILELTIIQDTPTGSKAYKLSPLGEKIVELLEQMEREFIKYHTQVPRDPKEFLEFRDKYND